MTISNDDVKDILSRLALTRPGHYVDLRRAKEGSLLGTEAAEQWLRTFATWSGIAGIYHNCRQGWDVVGLEDVPDLADTMARIGRPFPRELRQRDAFDRAFVERVIAFYMEHCKDWDDDDLDAHVGPLTT